MKRRYIWWPLLVVLASCVWDNEEELFPDAPPCDTTSVSYSLQIVPILSNNCYVCHSNLNAPNFGGGIPLEDYIDVAGKTSRLVGALRHKEGYEPMPRGMDQLDPCPINLVESWIDQGYPDN